MIVAATVRRFVVRNVTNSAASNGLERGGGNSRFALCHPDGRTVAGSAASGSGWGHGASDGLVSARFRVDPEGAPMVIGSKCWLDRDPHRAGPERWGGIGDLPLAMAGVALVADDARVVLDLDGTREPMTHAVRTDRLYVRISHNEERSRLAMPAASVAGCGGPYVGS